MPMADNPSNMIPMPIPKSPKRQRPKRKPDPWDVLSFIANRKEVGLPDGRFPRCFWNVKPTGQYGEDCYTGEKLALEYLSFIASVPGRPPDLPGIVGDMPRELTGIEVGFLTM